MASAVSALGHKVDILAAKGETRAKNIHILCQEHSGGRVSYAVFARELRKYLAENHYDIVHSVLPFDFANIYQPRSGTFAESIQRNAASYESKFIEGYKRLTAFANFRRTNLHRAEKKLCRKRDGPLIVALSNYVAGQFKRHYGVADERVVTVPNGVRINRKIDRKKADKLRTQILARLGITEADEPVFFLFAANNFRLKGLPALIKALHAAVGNPAARRAYLIVAGRGKSYRYRYLARKLGVQQKIVFLGSIRNIQDALSIVDVAVLPTFYDPSSRFILEALVAAKPVITTRFNGAADLFVSNHHGRVLESPEDIAGLAEAICYFTDKDNIQKASEAIIADGLKKEISITRAAEHLMSVYQSISAGFGGKTAPGRAE